MGDRCGMSISADSPSDETLNRGPLALLLRQQYEFPFGINIVQFSINAGSGHGPCAFTGSQVQHTTPGLLRLTLTFNMFTYKGILHYVPSVHFQDLFKFIDVVVLVGTESKSTCNIIKKDC